MVDVDKHFEAGGRRTPLSPQIKPFSLPGQVLSAWDPIIPGLCWCTMEGTPGRHGGPQIGSSGLLPQTGSFPLVGVGQVSPLRFRLKGRGQVSPPSEL